MTRREVPVFLGFAAAAVIAGFAVGTAGAAANVWVGPAVSGDDATRATATTVDRVKEINPAVASHYGLVSPCVPGMGVHYGPVVDGQPAMAPSVILSVNPVNNELTAMEIIVPADQPWQPWFDQPEGQPMELAPGMAVWTQHVFLVDPATIDDCPAPAE